MNTIGQISEINFEIGEIFISEWTLSLRGLGPKTPSGPLPPLGWAKGPSLRPSFFLKPSLREY